MTIKSGTGQACAACKYQRRRCTPECLLAPFFPADEPKMFQNVHRLFGVKHIKNLLCQLNPELRAMAMKSIKFHAAMRDKYPVFGCMYEVQQLTYQIQIAEEELQAVLQQLAYYQQQREMVSPANNINDSFSQLQLGIEPPGSGGSMSLVNHDNQPQYSAIATQASYSNNGNSDFNTNYMDAKENNAVDNIWIQQTCTNSVAMQSQLTVSQQPLPVQEETNHQHYNEVHPFFDNFDDRQSYIGSKEAYESSFESSAKDAREAIEQMAENELKSAAACFSLTSVN